MGSVNFEVLTLWPQIKCWSTYPRGCMARWPRGRNPSKSLKILRTPNISKKGKKPKKPKITPKNPLPLMLPLITYNYPPPPP